MKKILIIYPAEFKSYNKFFRKINNITSKFTKFDIVCNNDHHNFAHIYSTENKNASSFEIVIDWKECNFTHAVVFDDGEEFPNEVKYIKEQKKPIRVIRIKITRVINLKTSEKYSPNTISHDYEYIGRGSYWGNPYSIYEVSELEDGETPRDNVIRKFKYDFDHNCLLNRDKDTVFSLAGKRLGCYCKPEACHGDVIADFLNSWDDGE
ncbi:MAG: DUF4326 domain-containing protein [Aeromonas veronii]